MEVELMVTKRDDNRPTDSVNIEQSASGRLEGRVLQLVVQPMPMFFHDFPFTWLVKSVSGTHGSCFE